MLKLLDKDADGMGLWTATEDMTVVAHRERYDHAVLRELVAKEYEGRERPTFLVVVNGFWSGNGESWTTVAVPTAKKRKSRTAGGKCTLVDVQIRRRHRRHFSSRRYRAVDAIRARGVHLLKQWQDEPSNREIAETLNNGVGQRGRRV